MSSASAGVMTPSQFTSPRTSWTAGPEGVGAASSAGPGVAVGVGVRAIVGAGVAVGVGVRALVGAGVEVGVGVRVGAGGGS